MLLRAESGSFWTYLQAFTDGATLSADLKQRGFTFVGPVVCTSLLEAVAKQESQFDPTATDSLTGSKGGGRRAAGKK